MVSTFTLLYNQSPELSSACKAENLHTLNNNSPFPAHRTPSPAPGHHNSTFWLYDFDTKGHQVNKRKKKYRLILHMKRYKKNPKILTNLI